MNVSVVSRSGTPYGSFELAENAKLSDLKAAFHAKIKKYYPDRQRYTLPTSSATEKPVALDDNRTLKEQGVAGTVVFKDLGPQISWKLVFVIEYLGPLLIFPIFYLQPALIYGPDLPPMVVTQHVGFIGFMFHYVKRELETLFVHRFSNSTMPILNVFKNSSYYWGFAAGIAYFLFHPLYTPVSEDAYIWGLSLFLLFEVANFVTHVELAVLRPKGSKVRKVPHAGAFQYISCPNYTFEIMAWLGFNIFTRTLVGWMFFAFGTAQMFVWAMKKHANYKKEFDGKEGRELYPPERKMLIPFIL